MKRFSAFSAGLLLSAASAFACGYECPTFNKYMFSVIPVERYTADAPFRKDMDAYWESYYGKPYGDVYESFYLEYRDKLRAVAQKRGDQEMLSYMKWFDKYLEVSDDYTNDSWDYKKMSATQRAQKLSAVLQAAKAYKGTKLRGQYALLVMRCNMLTGKSQQNVLYWESTAKSLPEGVWREAARNIYANALLRTGKTLKACDIYVAQSDYASVRWAMRNYRSLAGIKSVYSQDKNAVSLQYLVQDFVNNVQETIDSRSDLGALGESVGTSDVKDLVTQMGGQAVFEDEARQFVAFALSAATDAGCKSPAMWQGAAAWVSCLLGDTQSAWKAAEKAVGMEGTERMADNARVIRLLVSAASREKVDKTYRKFLLGELQWLDGKVVAERAGGAEYANHYTDVKERVVHRGLMPLFRANGLDNESLALHAMCDANENDFYYTRMQADPASYLYANYPLGNPNNVYGPGVCERLCNVLDTLSAVRVIDYYKYVTSSKSAGSFEAYVTGQAYKGSDYFCDLIGTKCIAEGDYDAAQKWLGKVTMDYLASQYITHFAVRRDFTRPAWFERQRVKEQDDWGYVSTRESVNENYKAAYCRYMTGLLDSYKREKNTAEREALAYKLATAYFQASPYGDCWYLTHYGKSVTDTARAGELDYAAEAARYLSVSKASADKSMRYKSLYALAFLPVDCWYVTEWGTLPGGEYGEYAVTRPQSAQYRALAELDAFAKENPLDVDAYTTRCDVLRRFRQETAKGVSAVRPSFGQWWGGMFFAAAGR